MLLRDPVHDLVTFEAEEERVVPELLATAEMQRLRRIKQLGVTHLVFPGAEHSRFTHAVGAAHVMTRLIRRLRALHDELPFWQRLASDRARDALAASLLHDVGHGPYSHLFEEAIAGAPHHESWSLKIVRDPSTEVHKKLIAIDPGLPERVASLISGGEDPHPYPLPYLANAVSGTFDVDRCDYLLRDAHMTGVRYGLFDLDWLLRSLRFSPQSDGAPPRFAIDGMKGLPAIEGFVLARRFMFEQVYLHKATRAAEVMIKAIFARAAVLVRDGVRLDPIPRALELAAHGEEVPLSAYLALDDVTIGAAFAAWCGAKDPILSDLCLRLRVRRIGKTVELTGENAVRERADDLVARARDLATAAGLDADAHVALDVAEDVQSFGDADEGVARPAHAEAPLDVVLADGRARPLGAVSVLLARLDNVPIRRIRLVVPQEIRAEIVAMAGIP